MIGAFPPLLMMMGHSAIPYEEGGGPYTAESGAGSGGYTLYDRSWAIDNGATITHFSVYSTSAISVTVKIGLENSSTDIDTVVSEAFSHGGGGWQEFALSSPFNIPGSGTYRTGVYSASDFSISVEPVARSYAVGDATGDAVTFTASTAQVRITKVRGTI